MFVTATITSAYTEFSTLSRGIEHNAFQVKFLRPLIEVMVVIIVTTCMRASPFTIHACMNVQYSRFIFHNQSQT